MTSARDYILAHTIGQMLIPPKIPAGTAAVLLPASPRRVWLRIVTPVASTVAVSNVKPTSLLDGDNTLLSGSFIEFFIWRHGLVVQNPWYGWATATTLCPIYEGYYSGPGDLHTILRTGVIPLE
jgi:hypothetical protein